MGKVVIKEKVSPPFSTEERKMNRDCSLSQLQASDSSHNLSDPHYCGVYVGQEGYHNPCGDCDGRCGPDSGCQCRACHELDEEIAIRKRKMASLIGLTDPAPSFFNTDGIPCEVSYCPAARDGHFTAGYKSYCSRMVGREEYFPSHFDCNCDGQCGPNNGCQCRACYEIDEIFSMIAAPTTSPVVALPVAPTYSCTNRDNNVCHLSMDDYHQFRNVHYCGRFVGQYGYHNGCGDCDGHCGPDSGCQCEACHELDEEIARRKRALALTEGLTPAESPFVNGDGVECHVSFCSAASNGHYIEGFKFYCSRMVGHEGYFPIRMDCTCDGHCGPDNGCQCRACYELEQKLIPPPSLPTALSVDDLLCVVCCEAAKCIAIIPCGHVSMCQPCFSRLPDKKCPLCKGIIQSHIKVFL